MLLKGNSLLLRLISPGGHHPFSPSCAKSHSKYCIWSTPVAVGAPRHPLGTAGFDCNDLWRSVQRSRLAERGRGQGQNPCCIPRANTTLRPVVAARGQILPLFTSPCLTVIPLFFPEINRATCSREMRWHFPIMRAMGGREGISAFPGSAIDRDWHFPLQSQNVHVLLHPSGCVWMYVWFRQQTPRRSSILLQPYPKVCVCVDLSVVLWVAPVCVTEHKRVCMWGKKKAWFMGASAAGKLWVQRRL